MKYIKLFEYLEPKSDSNLRENKNPKFQIGDLVKIKRGRSYPEFQNKIFITTSLENTDIDGGLWGMRSLEDPSGMRYTHYFYGKILTKPTKKDFENLELRQDTNKYNL